jgi:hypothetical protein
MYEIIFMFSIPDVKYQMPFKKGNQYGKVEKPLAKAPLSIKLEEGMREKIMTIPNWSDEVRTLISDWYRRQEL